MGTKATGAALVVDTLNSVDLPAAVAVAVVTLTIASD